MKATVAFVVLFFGCAFAAFTQYEVNRPNVGAPIAIPQVIDYNGDGRDDFIVHTQTSTGGDYHVIINNGGYSFAAPQLLVSYTNPTLGAFWAGDFDNDGDIDLASVWWVNVSRNALQIVTYENNRGSFVRRAASSSILNDVYSITATDINSDGYLDIIVSHYPYVSAFYGHGCFAFDQQTILAQADCHQPAFKPGRIAANTYPNVVFSACWTPIVHYIYFDGTTIASRQVGRDGTYNAYSLAVADFNGDSYTDVIAAGMSCWNVNKYIYTPNNNSFYRAEPGLNPPGGAPCNSRSFVAAGDLDGNGFGDIIVEVNNNVHILWHTSATTTSWETLPGTYTSTSTAFAFPIYITGKFSKGAENSDLVMVTGSSALTVFTTCPACASCPANSYVNDAGTCVGCPLNHVSLPGARKCTRVCAAGLYGVYPNCAECPVGSYSNAGATACTYCPPHQVSPGGSTPCSSCSANFYPTGKSVCTSCPLGTYSVAGSISCTPCPSGSVRGCFEACVSCPSGTYATIHSCSPCPPGTFSGPGASACTKCASGTFSGSSAPLCTACPAGHSSSSTNAFCYQP